MQAHPLSTTASWNTVRSHPASAAAEYRPTVANGAGLAHDAGNLLGALELYCGLLQAPGVLQPHHSHYARELHALAQRSSVLIERLLHAAAVDHTARDQYEDTHSLHGGDPTEWLRGVTSLLQSLAGPAVRLTVASSPCPAGLPFEAETFERIVVNLVCNASAAMDHRTPDSPDAPAIHIELAQTIDSAISLSISDTAGGIPLTAAAAFLRPHPTFRDVTCGLGHRIVHELLNATRGELSIRVRRGRGTTFTILWPTPQTQAALREVPC